MEPQVDLQDWEFLNEPSSASSPNPNPFEDSDGGAIKPDYFSPNPIKPQLSQQEPDSTSVESDNPSWIDPDSHSPQPRGRLTASFWSDEESSEGSKSVVADDDGEELGVEKEIEEEEEEEEEEVKDGVLRNCSEGGEEKGWWKVPLEILKLWVVRAKPVWSISIAAAAIVGVVMLGRRLMYRMKQRSKGIPLKIAMDDKILNNNIMHIKGIASMFNKKTTTTKRALHQLKAHGTTNYAIKIIGNFAKKLLRNRKRKMKFMHTLPSIPEDAEVHHLPHIDFLCQFDGRAKRKRSTISAAYDSHSKAIQKLSYTRKEAEVQYGLHIPIKRRGQFDCRTKRKRLAISAASGSYCKAIYKQPSAFENMEQHGIYIDHPIKKPHQVDNVATWKRSTISAASSAYFKAARKGKNLVSVKASLST